MGYAGLYITGTNGTKGRTGARVQATSRFGRAGKTSGAPWPEVWSWGSTGWFYGYKADRKCRHTKPYQAAIEGDSRNWRNAFVPVACGLCVDCATGCRKARFWRPLKGFQTCTTARSWQTEAQTGRKQFGRHHFKVILGDIQILHTIFITDIHFKRGLCA